jgi:DNA polymerase III, chi subunit
MTIVDFYTHVSDPMRVAVQLVRKAYPQHGKIRVLTESETMTEQIDKRLWVEPATDFLPHCRLNHPLADETPILIDHSLTHDGSADVLINLQHQVPEFFSRFERLVEIVSTDHTAVMEGRKRYRFYQERGYMLRAHNLSGR